jgi:hypothetical protein
VNRNGSLNSEPADVFKQWMKKHDYDPEHGKNTPVQVAAADDPDRAAAPGKAPTATSAPPPR